MASLLCGGIGDLCRAICLCPCKTCGAALDAIGKLCTNPFSPLIAVSMASQLPPMVKGFQELVEAGGSLSCRGIQYMLGAIAFGVVHIAASLYLAVKIENRRDPKMQHLHTATKRVSHLMCKDPVMAAYILVWLGYFAFIIWGCTWNWSGYMDGGGCTESISGSVGIAIGCGFFFIFGGLLASCCSMCCACCNQRDYSYSAPPPDAPLNQPQQQQTPLSDVETPSSNAPPAPTQTNVSEPAPSLTPVTIYHSDETKLSPPVAPPNEKTPQNSVAASDKDARPPVTATTQSEVPLVHAVPIQNTAPTYTEAPIQSSAPPSAPPMECCTQSSAEQQQAAHHQQQQHEETETGADGTLGGMVGKNIGKLFKMDESKQHNLETQGEKAGDAVGKGFSNAKNFVGSKLEKKK